MLTSPAYLLLGVLIACYTICAQELLASTSSPYDTHWVGRFCEGQTLYLWCEPGRTINIDATFWGRTSEDICTGDGLDTSSTSCMAAPSEYIGGIEAACKDQVQCSIEATVEELGTDPCPGIHKVLEVDYTCKMATKSGMICEGDILELSCPVNQVLKVYAGFYGRTALTHCNPREEFMSTDCDGASDIGDKVGAICDSAERCDVRISNKYLGDPCPGTSKYLQVNYVCDSCENLHRSDDECEEWAGRGECEDNQSWMNSNCRKACWKCHTDHESCQNYDDNCEVWASYGECEINPDFMLSNCPQACMDCRPNSQFVAEEDVDYGASVCEGQWVNANCGVDHTMVLRISNLFFGRDDNDICPHDSILTTDCPSLANTEDKAQALCDGRHSCFLGADTWQLGDPCPGTYKYLSLTHTCQKCGDVLSAETCLDLAEAGECTNHKEYMMDNCLATCTQCKHAECYNMHGSDKDCDRWAASGECQTNPDMMNEQCKKSCRQCLPNVDNTCINWYGTSKCEEWAYSGECHSNPYWMRDNCRSACELCDEGDCINRNLNCIYWASIGECETNSEYMLAKCAKACQTCQSETESGCHNALESDELCDQWAESGECAKNPDFMNVSCAKSCNVC